MLQDGGFLRTLLTKHAQQVKTTAFDKELAIGLPRSPDEAQERRAFQRQAILLNVVLWFFIYVVLTVRAPLIEEVPLDELAWRRIFTVVAGALYSYGLTYPLRLVPLTAFWQRILLGVVLAIVGSTLHACTHLFVFHRLFPVPGASLLIDPFTPTYVIRWSIFWLGYYLTAVAAYLALLYSSEFRRNERSLSMMRAFADDAHLRTLRYQINPHFLFNTLNSISALVLDRKTDDAERMLQALSDFYRSTLATDPHDEIRLGEEIEIQRLYLAVEEVRFSDRLDVRLDVPTDLKECWVPALLLQPIVENAIKHGIAKREQHSTLEVVARQRGDGLSITVRNDRGDKAVSLSGLGVGLSNVQQRLRAHYGDQAELRCGADSGKWVCEITLPLRCERA